MESRLQSISCTANCYEYHYFGFGSVEIWIKKINIFGTVSKWFFRLQLMWYFLILSWVFSMHRTSRRGTVCDYIPTFVNFWWTKHASVLQARHRTWEGNCTSPCRMIITLKWWCLWNVEVTVLTKAANQRCIKLPKVAGCIVVTTHLEERDDKQVKPYDERIHQKSNHRIYKQRNWYT